MAEIYIEKTGTTVRVEDGSRLTKLASELNTGMACHGSGVCGSCIFRVLAGQANLSELQDMEKRVLERNNAPVNGDARLLCRTKIESGEITVEKFDRSLSRLSQLAAPAVNATRESHLEAASI